ncbi:EAL domain-containing protein [Paenibacillus sp. OV219]|uniref:EAL domain-containing protein n=1 Tax=Paenibacillus sp. OV219 TaxID=1884377 RepID=UPI0008C985E8|nr:EAL domain-containing protein [Paenibacillus sp. OV219]SEM71522.1 diguanylate cyclase (GGDEF) domain-containing protein [Paenibacillus sp. OV219]
MRKLLGLADPPAPYGVLVVDDSAVMRQMISRLIEKDPKLWVMGTASNGQEALEKLKVMRPDLVTMDIEMPVLDGLSALSQLMVENPMPVIMLSSYTDEGASPAIAALTNGAADFFHKDSLFQFPANAQMEEEFLLRCHAAIESKPFWKTLDQEDLANHEMKVLLEFMTGCLASEHTIHEELNQTLQQLNGFYCSLIKQANEFIVTECKGELLTRFGQLSQSLIGHSLEHIVPAEVMAQHSEYLTRVWNGEDCVSYDTEWRKYHFTTVARPVRVNGIVKEIIVVTFEVTDRKRMEEKIKFLLNHDQLTGLPNQNQLLTEMDRAKTKYGRFAVLFFKFDHFKQINDSMGHEKGDSLLQLMARRLKRFTSEDTTIIRAGSDEFICVMGGATFDTIERYAERLLDAIRQPIILDGLEIHMTSSLGISQYPDNHTNIEHIIRYAHMAMNIAQTEGGNLIQFYEARFQEEIHRKMEIERRLRKAIDREEFYLNYQPVFNGIDRTIKGLECLIRWQSPELGRVSPADFIPIAEETGLIHAIGEWVMLEACRTNKRWQDEGLMKIPVAVNLSTQQFNDGKIIERIENILQETGLDPKYLVVEITESMTMNKHHALMMLKNLKRIGVSIAIDDFGTGYSSLSYLSELPIDKLKVDQSFVKKMDTHGVNASIVHTIITMAENLKLEVIAEGVETEAEFGLLLRYGCNTMQGYLLGRPMEAAQIAEELKLSKPIKKMRIQ